MTKLKPRHKFYSSASSLLSKLGTQNDVIELSKEYEISEDEVKEYLKRKTVSKAVSGAVMASSEEKELIYNSLDQKFIEQYDTIVVFNRGENTQFYEYKNGVYSFLYEQQIYNYVDTLLAQHSLHAHRTVKRKVKDTVTRIISLLSRTEKRHFTDKDLIGRKWYLNLKNGLLDMDSFELKNHTSEYFSTVQVPYDFDPKATSPMFDQFMATVSNGDPMTAQMVQEMFGYCLLEGNPKHKVFYLYGDTARNGKSTTAKIICGLLGWGNVSTLSLSQVGGESSSVLTSLVGKQLNFSDEISSKYIESSRLTMMAAEGLVEINPKYEPTYLYKVTCKFLIACNDLPRFQDSQGMKHRMISIPFLYQIPEKDRVERYDERLLEKEGSGILNWAIEGIRIITRNNGFSINQQSMEDAHENMLHSNSVYAFLESEYDFDPSFTTEMYNDFLYGKEHTALKDGTEYRIYCARKGIKPYSEFTFSKEMKRFERETKKIIQRRDSKGYRYYIGLRRKLEERGTFEGYDIVGDALNNF